MNEILFVGQIVQIGAFRCSPDSVLWSEDNHSGPHPCVAFPRTTVTIEHGNLPPILATPNHVMFYNPGSVYRRSLHSRRGDHCEFFRLRADVATDLVRTFDPEVSERGDRVFPFPEGPGNARAYLVQRRLYDYVQRTPTPDPVFIEETFLGELSSVLEETFAKHASLRALPLQKKRNHFELVESAKSVIAEKFRESLTLDWLASYIGSSPFHLCRLFRSFTGMTVHRYINSLRLRAALDDLPKNHMALTHIALQTGFSSHSHFSSAFRREFGVSPSSVRRQETRDLLARLTS